MRASRILIAGLNGLGAEIAKNTMLSGVKSVKLPDYKNVTEEESTSQFLIPPDSLGKNRAESSLARARALNPMVEVTADVETVTKKPEEYFENFGVAFVSEVETNEMARIDDIWRRKNIKFFAGDLWGMFGYSFADLQSHDLVEDVRKHKITSKPNEKAKTDRTSFYQASNSANIP